MLLLLPFADTAAGTGLAGVANRSVSKGLLLLLPASGAGGLAIAEGVDGEPAPGTPVAFWAAAAPGAVALPAGVAGSSFGVGPAARLGEAPA
jgi:hypothetical protein